jgi:hypothetical protein
MGTATEIYPSRSGEAKRTQPQSTQFADALRKNLAILGEHYRQPITKLSVIAYAEDLRGLTPAELDAACVRARQTSEFMPVSAAILKAHREIQESRRGEFLGVPLIEYPPITQEERNEALAFSEELKKKLGAAPTKPEKRSVPVRPSLHSLEEQKRILREKGFLR